MSAVSDTVLSRIKGPGSERAKEAATAVFGQVSKLEARKAELDADKTLSPEGRRIKLAEFVKTDLAKHLAWAAKPIRTTLAESQVKRDAFVIPTPDRTDPVAEMRRAEMRTYVRSLQPGERMSAVFDPAMAEAVLDAPPALSGFKGDNAAAFVGQITDYRREQLFGAKLKALDAADSPYTEANNAVSIVHRELQQASGLHPAEFDNLVKTFET